LGTSSGKSLSHDNRKSVGTTKDMVVKDMKGTNDRKHSDTAQSTSGFHTMNERRFWMASQYWLGKCISHENHKSLYEMHFPRLYVNLTLAPLAPVLTACR